MKKVLKVVGIIIAVILLLMICVPLFFKGKIKDLVVNTANEQLDAKIEITNFGLNLFSNFPNATLSLDDVLVVGSGDFQADTLLNAKSASVTIDLSSLFGGNYKISKINLDNVSLYAKVLEDGRANWDIMKSDSTTVEEESASDDSPFNLNLKKITLKDCNITYDDQQGAMKAILKGWDGSISGDFSASETTIKTSSVINEITFVMDGVPYMSKIKGTVEAAINADLDNMKFKFDNSRLQLNELIASIDGSFAMVGEDDNAGMDFDLKLNAPDTQFKDILSLAPAMYTDDFKDLKTAGTVNLDASVKGLMQGETYPAFDVKIIVSDAMFQYPSLPKSVSGININLAVNSKGGSLDNTIVDINKFTFNLGGNPFSGGLKVTTPISDPNLKAHANGTLDLGMVKDVYPLDKGTQLNGKIVADVKIEAAMSYIEKELYDKIAAMGHLTLSNMVYKSGDMADVEINSAALEFTPRYVNLSTLDVKIGKNDIAATGRVENFIGYALKGHTLKGQLNLKSNYFNLNDFMGGEETPAVADTTAAPSEDIIIPKNIDFALNAAFQKVIYEKINITNLNGAMTVKDGILTMKNVSANALGGACKITGAYNTSAPKTPKVDMTLNLTNVSFSETFKSVDAMQKLAPVFENMEGSYTMSLDFNTLLGSTTDETLNHLIANGNLQTSDVKIQDVEVLNKLATALKNEKLRTITPKDLKIPFTVKDGKITTKPFNVNLGNGGMMKLEGVTSLNQTIDYKGTVTLPKSLANDYLNNVGITIGGTFSDPKIGLDTKSLVTNVVGSAAEKLLGDKLSSKLNAGKAEQAQKMREESQKASDKLVEAATKQANSLVSKAGKNPIAKATAKAAGDKLVNEAKKQGKKLVDEAEIKAKQLEAEEGGAAEAAQE